MSDNIISFPPTKIKHVKICRFAERFWVKVEGAEYGTIYGTVANDLVTSRLKHGDYICFQEIEILEEQAP